MRVLVIGAGGVGSAVARTAARWGLFERVVMADYDEGRAQRAIAGGGDRFAAFKLDARDEQAIVELIRAERCDAVLNALDPRFVMPVFRAALAAGVTYLDMAMSLSRPHASDPYRQPGVKLGDEQFALAGEWERRGLLALCGIGVEPGLSDVFTRYAADRLFATIDEAGVRDGANLVVEGYEFAPTFSIWTTIEECLNPPIVWERGRQWYTTEPFSEPETFVFPAGIGPLECVNVEHEEVLLIPRWIDAWPGDLQVRAGRGVHRRAEDDPQTGPRLDRPRPGGRGRRLAAGRDRRLPARPGRARRRHVGAHLRRHLGHRDGQGRVAARGLPAPRRGQRLVDGRVRLAGRGLADRDQPGGGTRTARLGRMVRRRRPRSRGAARPSRSSTSSTAMAPPGSARSALPPSADARLAPSGAPESARFGRSWP